MAREEVLKGSQGLEKMIGEDGQNRGTLALELAVGTDLDEALDRVANRRVHEARVPLVSGGPGVGDNAVAVAVRVRARRAVEKEERRIGSARIAAQARFDAAQSSEAALESSVGAADSALRLVDARYSEELESLDAWLGVFCGSGMMFGCCLGRERHRRRWPSRRV